ncbi:hypothetical protein F5Y02DRAFT_402707 [Annulohypoxylon stygium]|nr:hypothetical protein F5Y02DRAFT_402707 [Annulohypoxylon stygium]
MAPKIVLCLLALGSTTDNLAISNALIFLLLLSLQVISGLPGPSSSPAASRSLLRPFIIAFYYIKYSKTKQKSK